MNKWKYIVALMTIPFILNAGVLTETTSEIQTLLDAVPLKALITDGVATNMAMNAPYATSVGAGSSNIVTQAEITSVSNSLDTAYIAADTAVSNGVTTAFGSADTTVSNGLTTAFGAADTVVSNGLVAAYGAADTVVSNGLVTAYGAADTVVSNAFVSADTVVSNGVTTAFGNADTAVSNGLTTAYGVADTAVSNGVTTAFGAADTVVSNGLVTAYGAADTVVSNGLVTAYGAADTVVSNAFVSADAAKVSTNHTGNVSITGTVTINSDEYGTSYIGQNLQTGTSYTLVLTDKGKIIEMNNASANTLTIPANASVAFPVDTRIDVVQYGAGLTTVEITTDTLRGDPVSQGQYKGLSLWKRAATEWVVFGGTTE